MQSPVFVRPLIEFILEDAVNVTLFNSGSLSAHITKVKAIFRTLDQNVVRDQIDRQLRALPQRPTVAQGQSKELLLQTQMSAMRNLRDSANVPAASKVTLSSGLIVNIDPKTVDVINVFDVAKKTTENNDKTAMIGALGSVLEAGLWKTLPLDDAIVTFLGERANDKNEFVPARKAAIDALGKLQNNTQAAGALRAVIENLNDQYPIETRDAIAQQSYQELATAAVNAYKKVAVGLEPDFLVQNKLNKIKNDPLSIGKEWLTINLMSEIDATLHDKVRAIVPYGYKQSTFSNLVEDKPLRAKTLINLSRPIPRVNYEDATRRFFSQMTINIHDFHKRMDSALAVCSSALTYAQSTGSRTALINQWLFGADILNSEYAIMTLVSDHYDEQRDPVKFKGKSNPLAVYMIAEKFKDPVLRDKVLWALAQFENTRANAQNNAVDIRLKIAKEVLADPKANNDEVLLALRILATSKDGDALRILADEMQRRINVTENSNLNNALLAAEILHVRPLFENFGPTVQDKPLVQKLVAVVEKSAVLNENWAKVDSYYKYALPARLAEQELKELLNVRDTNTPLKNTAVEEEIKQAIQRANDKDKIDDVIWKWLPILEHGDKKFYNDRVLEMETFYKTFDFKVANWKTIYDVSNTLTWPQRAAEIAAGFAGAGAVVAIIYFLLRRLIRKLTGNNGRGPRGGKRKSNGPKPTPQAPVEEFPFDPNNELASISVVMHDAPQAPIDQAKAVETKSSFVRTIKKIENNRQNNVNQSTTTNGRSETPKDKDTLIQEALDYLSQIIEIKEKKTDVKDRYFTTDEISNVLNTIIFIIRLENFSSPIKVADNVVRYKSTYSQLQKSINKIITDFIYQQAKTDDSDELKEVLAFALLIIQETRQLINNILGALEAIYSARRVFNYAIPKFFGKSERGQYLADLYQRYGTKFARSWHTGLDYNGNKYIQAALEQIKKIHGQSNGFIPGLYKESTSEFLMQWSALLSSIKDGKKLEGGEEKDTDFSIEHYWRHSQIGRRILVPLGITILLINLVFFTGLTLMTTLSLLVISAGVLVNYLPFILKNKSGLLADINLVERRFRVIEEELNNIFIGRAKHIFTRDYFKQLQWGKKMDALRYIQSNPSPLDMIIFSVENDLDVVRASKEYLMMRSTSLFKTPIIFMPTEVGRGSLWPFLMSLDYLGRSTTLSELWEYAKNNPSEGFRVYGEDFINTARFDLPISQTRRLVLLAGDAQDKEMFEAINESLRKENFTLPLLSKSLLEGSEGVFTARDDMFLYALKEALLDMYDADRPALYMAFGDQFLTGPLRREGEIVLSSQKMSLEDTNNQKMGVLVQDLRTLEAVAVVEPFVDDHLVFAKRIEKVLAGNNIFNRYDYANLGLEQFPAFTGFMRIAFNTTEREVRFISNVQKIFEWVRESDYDILLKAYIRSGAWFSVESQVHKLVSVLTNVLGYSIKDARDWIDAQQALFFKDPNSNELHDRFLEVMPIRSLHIVGDFIIPLVMLRTGRTLKSLLSSRGISDLPSPINSYFEGLQEGIGRVFSKENSQPIHISIAYGFESVFQKNQAKNYPLRLKDELVDHNAKPRAPTAVELRFIDQHVLPFIREQLNGFAPRIRVNNGLKYFATVRLNEIHLNMNALLRAPPQDLKIILFDEVASIKEPQLSNDQVFRFRTIPYIQYLNAFDQHIQFVEKFVYDNDPYLAQLRAHRLTHDEERSTLLVSEQAILSSEGEAAQIIDRSTGVPQGGMRLGMDNDRGAGVLNPNRYLKVLDLLNILSIGMSGGWIQALLGIIIFRVSLVLGFVVNEAAHTFAAGVTEDRKFLNKSNLLGNLTPAQIFYAAIPVVGYFKAQPHARVPATWSIRLAGFVSNLTLLLLSLAGYFGFISWLSFVSFPMVFGFLVTTILSFITDVLNNVYDEEVNCGNFGFGWIDNSLEPEINPDWAVEARRNQLTMITIRGGQTAGMIQSFRDAAGGYGMLMLKAMKGKRPLLADVMERAWAKKVIHMIKQGAKGVLGVNLLSGHVRFATAGKAKPNASHPHVDFVELNVEVWSFDVQGALVKTTETVIVAITHNGDFDYFDILGRKIDNDELRQLLKNVFHVEQVKKPFDYPFADETPGDSPPASGAVRLFFNQGMFTSAVINSWILNVIKTPQDIFNGKKPLEATAKDNTALSIKDRNTIAGVIDNIFKQHAAAISKFNANKPRRTLSDLWVEVDQTDDAVKLKQRERLNQLRQDITKALLADQNAAAIVRNWHLDAQQLDVFVEGVLRAFFINDRYRATRAFAQRAEGSFGVVVRTSLNNGLSFFTRDQAISFGFNTKEKFFGFASESLVLQVKYGSKGYLTKRYDMDITGKGEVADLNMYADGRFQVSVYNMNIGREISGNEFFNNLMSLNENNQFYRPLVDYAGVKNYVKFDMEDTARVLLGITNSFSNPASLNHQSAQDLLAMLEALFIENEIKSRTTGFSTLRPKFLTLIERFARNQVGLVDESAREKFVTDMMDAVEGKSLLEDYFYGMAEKFVSDKIDELSQTGQLDQAIDLNALSKEFDKELSAWVLVLSRNILAYLNSSFNKVRNDWDWEHDSKNAMNAFVDAINGHFHEKIHKNKIADFEKRHLIITGFEKSQWVGEKLKEILEVIFPYLNISAISSNKLVDDPRAYGATRRTIFFAISDSGQTFPTLAGVGKLQSMFPGRVFVLNNRPDTIMAKGIGQRFSDGAPFSRRLFITDANIRISEASTVDTTALIWLVNELAVFLHRGMRQKYSRQYRFMMEINKEGFRHLMRLRNDALKKIEQVLGVDHKGLTIESTVSATINEKAHYLAWRIKEVMWGKVFNVSYLILNFSIPALIWNKLFITGVIFGMNLNFVAVTIETLLFLFNLYGFTIVMRYFKNHPLWDRLGMPTFAIGAESAYHQLLEILVRKLHATAHASQEVAEHGGNAEDHFGARFLSGVRRGTKAFFFLPIDPQRAANVATTAKQTKGILTGWSYRDLFTGGAEVFTTGLRVANEEATDHSKNSNVTDHHIHLGDVDFRDASSDVRKLYGIMYDGLINMVAVQKMFVLTFSEVALVEPEGLDRLITFWRYNPWNSTSQTKVYTTRSPKPVSSGQIVDVIGTPPVEIDVQGKSDYPSRFDFWHHRLDTDKFTSGDELLARQQAYVRAALEGLSLPASRMNNIVITNAVPKEILAQYDFKTRRVLLNVIPMSMLPPFNTNERSSTKFLAVLKDVLRHEILGHEALGENEQQAIDVTLNHFTGKPENFVELQHLYDGLDILGAVSDDEYARNTILTLMLEEEQRQAEYELDAVFRDFEKDQQNRSVDTYVGLQYDSDQAQMRYGYSGVYRNIFKQLYSVVFSNHVDHTLKPNHFAATLAVDFLQTHPDQTINIREAKEPRLSMGNLLADMLRNNRVILIDLTALSKASIDRLTQGRPDVAARLKNVLASAGKMDGEFKSVGLAMKAQWQGVKDRGDEFIFIFVNQQLDDLGYLNAIQIAQRLVTVVGEFYHVDPVKHIKRQVDFIRSLLENGKNLGVQVEQYFGTELPRELNDVERRRFVQALSPETLKFLNNKAIDPLKIVWINPSNKFLITWVTASSVIGKAQAHQIYVHPKAFEGNALEQLDLNGFIRTKVFAGTAHLGLLLWTDQLPFGLSSSVRNLLKYTGVIAWHEFGHLLGALMFGQKVRVNFHEGRIDGVSGVTFLFGFFASAVAALLLAAAGLYVEPVTVAALITPYIMVDSILSAAPILSLLAAGVISVFVKYTLFAMAGLHGLAAIFEFISAKNVDADGIKYIKRHQDHPMTIEGMQKAGFVDLVKDLTVFLQYLQDTGRIRGSPQELRVFEIARHDFGNIVWNPAFENGEATVLKLLLEVFPANRAFEILEHIRVHEAESTEERAILAQKLLVKRLAQDRRRQATIEVVQRSIYELQEGDDPKAYESDKPYVRIYNRTKDGVFEVVIIRHMTLSDALPVAALQQDIWMTTPSDIFDAHQAWGMILKNPEGQLVAEVAQNGSGAYLGSVIWTTKVMLDDLLLAKIESSDVKGTIWESIQKVRNNFDPNGNAIVPHSTGIPYLKGVSKDRKAYYGSHFPKDLSKLLITNIKALAMQDSNVEFLMTHSPESAIGFHEVFGAAKFNDGYFFSSRGDERRGVSMIYPLPNTKRVYILDFQTREQRLDALLTVRKLQLINGRLYWLGRWLSRTFELGKLQRIVLITQSPRFMVRVDDYRNKKDDYYQIIVRLPKKAGHAISIAGMAEAKMKYRNDTVAYEGFSTLEKDLKDFIIQLLRLGRVRGTASELRHFDFAKHEAGKIQWNAVFENGEATVRALLLEQFPQQRAYEILENIKRHEAQPTESLALAAQVAWFHELALDKKKMVSIDVTLKDIFNLRDDQTGSHYIMNTPHIRVHNFISENDSVLVVRSMTLADAFTIPTLYPDIWLRASSQELNATEAWDMINSDLQKNLIAQVVNTRTGESYVAGIVWAFEYREDIKFKLNETWMTPYRRLILGRYFDDEVAMLIRSSIQDINQIAREKYLQSLSSWERFSRYMFPWLYNDNTSQDSHHNWSDLEQDKAASQERDVLRAKQFRDLAKWTRALKEFLEEHAMLPQGVIAQSKTVKINGQYVTTWKWMITVRNNEEPQDVIYYILTNRLGLTQAQALRFIAHVIAHEQQPTEKAAIKAQRRLMKLSNLDRVIGIEGSSEVISKATWKNMVNVVVWLFIVLGIIFQQKIPLYVFGIEALVVFIAHAWLHYMQDPVIIDPIKSSKSIFVPIKTQPIVYSPEPTLREKVAAKQQWIKAQYLKVFKIAWPEGVPIRIPVGNDIGGIVYEAVGYRIDFEGYKNDDLLFLMVTLYAEYFQLAPRLQLRHSAKFIFAMAVLKTSIPYLLYLRHESDRKVRLESEIAKLNSKTDHQLFTFFLVVLNGTEFNAPQAYAKSVGHIFGLRNEETLLLKDTAKDVARSSRPLKADEVVALDDKIKNHMPSIQLAVDAVIAKENVEYPFDHERKLTIEALDQLKGSFPSQKDNFERMSQLLRKKTTIIINAPAGLRIDVTAWARSLGVKPALKILALNKNIFINGIAYDVIILMPQRSKDIRDTMNSIVHETGAMLSFAHEINEQIGNYVAEAYVDSTMRPKEAYETIEYKAIRNVAAWVSIVTFVMTQGSFNTQAGLNYALGAASIFIVSSISGFIAYMTMRKSIYNAIRTKMPSKVFDINTARVLTVLGYLFLSNLVYSIFFSNVQLFRSEHFWLVTPDTGWAESMLLGVGLTLLIALKNDIFARKAELKNSSDPARTLLPLDEAGLKEAHDFLFFNRGKILNLVKHELRLLKTDRNYVDVRGKIEEFFHEMKAPEVLVQMLEGQNEGNELVIVQADKKMQDEWTRRVGDGNTLYAMNTRFAAKHKHVYVVILFPAALKNRMVLEQTLVYEIFAIYYNEQGGRTYPQIRAQANQHVSYFKNMVIRYKIELFKSNSGAVTLIKKSIPNLRQLFNQRGRLDILDIYLRQLTQPSAVNAVRALVYIIEDNRAHPELWGGQLLTPENFKITVFDPNPEDLNIAKRGRYNLEYFKTNAAKRFIPTETQKIIDHFFAFADINHVELQEKYKPYFEFQEERIEDYAPINGAKFDLIMMQAVEFKVEAQQDPNKPMATVLVANRLVQWIHPKGMLITTAQKWFNEIPEFTQRYSDHVDLTFMGLSNIPIYAYERQYDAYVAVYFREWFDRLLARAYAYDQDINMPLILKAFDIAYEQHKDEKRSDGHPYIFHLLGVMEIVLNNRPLLRYLNDLHVRLDVALSTALLHDWVEARIKEVAFGETLEQSKANLEGLLSQVEAASAKEIVFMIDVVTKRNGETDADFIHAMRKRVRQIQDKETLRLLLAALGVIKVADSVSNLTPRMDRSAKDWLEKINRRLDFIVSLPIPKIVQEVFIKLYKESYHPLLGVVTRGRAAQRMSKLKKKRKARA